MSREFVEAIRNTMSDDEYLIIACPACDSGIKKSNITIKKIPQAVLARCEFGKDNYNLNVRQSGTVDDDDDDMADEFELEELEELEEYEEADEEADMVNSVHPQGNDQLSLGFDEFDE